MSNRRFGLTAVCVMLGAVSCAGTGPGSGAVQVSMDWASYIGGSGFDEARGLGADRSGNIYVGGMTSSRDWPGAGTYGGDPNDMMAAGFSPSGTQRLFATTVGGSERDEAKAVAVDDEGYVYLAGRTSSPDFPVTPGALNLRGATYDIAVVKLAPDGAVVYAAAFGGESMEEVRGIGVDNRGQCVVVGGTHSTDFPTTPDSWAPVYTDPREPDPEKRAGKPFEAEDAFVAKLNTDGTAFVYCTYLGGHGFDKAWAAAVDAEGRAYVTGHTQCQDFPVTDDALQKTFGGGEQDAFVAVLSSDGRELLYGSYLGGAGKDAGSGIDVDDEGRFYVGVNTRSGDMPVRNAWQSDLAGGQDLYVASFDPGTHRLLWATYLGGPDDEALSSDGLRVSGDGAVWLAGSTDSDRFPVTQNAPQKDRKGGKDAIIAGFRPGGALYLATYLGGRADDTAAAASPISDGSIAVAGRTASTDFPARRAFKMRASPGGEAFVARFTIEPLAP